MTTEVSSHAPDQDALGMPGWRGTARYEVLRCLGQGGMGVVYEAFDRERDRYVALKTLLRFSPAALYRFKQEFRTLADVQHPNLVRLYELVADHAERFFFTMELVRGQDFRKHTRRPGVIKPFDRPTVAESPRAVTPPRATGAHDVSASGWVLPSEPRNELTATPADVDRLRVVLRQLVEGVQALHAAGKLHRDIKPSNVLVTAEERVVLLDFGVATDLSRVVDQNLLESETVGTADYMAPEQALEATPTTASDWYSVGAMLYEALVGRPPFVGPVPDVLGAKTLIDPRPPGECVEGVPTDLDTLCSALLKRDPGHRPTGDEVLHRLGAGGRVARAVPTLPPGLTDSTPLIGRADQLRALRSAFDNVREGHSVTVRVTGASGLGKSSLVQHFLDGLVQRGEAVTLRGRAYERESVPYKAVDGVIDALSRYMKRLEERGDGIVLPRGAGALACLFPVLKRVEAIAAIPAESIADPVWVRQRAFVALRELLWELSARQPLVLYVDDAQWGDVDSATLWLEAMRPPRAPPILLIMTYLDGESESSPFLVEMLGRWPKRAEVSDLAVGPLDPEDAQRLALARLGADSPRNRAIATAIARESGGSAFLIEELACGGSAHLDGTPADSSISNAGVTLDQMVRRRLSNLDSHARKVLELVAVSGRPQPSSILGEAAGIGRAVDDAIASLGSHRFVRTGLRHGRDVVETTHDRIRETVVARLTTAAVRQRHASLAEALESQPETDPEALVVHLLGAGERQRAAAYAERAAEKAAQKLAFDRAVQLYRLTLEAVPPLSSEARRLQVHIAKVLEGAGRGAEAALVYLDAVQGAGDIERADLERAAAAQLLSCGRIDEGVRVLRRVLTVLRIRAPRSSFAALVGMLLWQLWLRILGLRFVDRTGRSVRRDDNARIEALYAAAMGLGLVDVMVGGCMQARQLALALRAGDGSHVVRAATMQASQLAGRGGPEGRRERALVKLARRYAAERSSSEDGAFLHGSEGMRSFLRGRWKDAYQALEQASGILTNRFAGWQSNAQLFSAYSLTMLGDLAELARRLPQMLEDAERRGDLYTMVNLRSGLPSVVWLAADEPETARRNVREAIEQWSHGGFLLQHWSAMASEVEIELYIGDGASAYGRLEREAPELRRSLLLLTSQYVRSRTRFLRARCAIAAMDANPALRNRRLTEADRMRRLLAREGMAWTDALESLVAACVANATGDRAETRALLQAAVQYAESADMSLYASAARYRLAALKEGGEAAALACRAEDEMRARGVRAPERFTAMVLPGRWRKFSHAS